MENRFYTIEEMIASIYTRIESDNTRDELIFREWIYDAIREIGPSHIHQKTECIPVSDLCFVKPCDYMYLLDLNLKDNSGCIYHYQYKNGFLTTENSNYSGGSLGIVNVSETKDGFVLSSNGSTITTAELSYYAFPIDANGEMIIKEDNKLPIIAYVEFQYVKRKRMSNRNEIPMSEVDYFRNQWILEMQKAKGRNKMPNQVQAEAIMRNWMTMIPNFRNKVRYNKGTYRGSI